MWVRSCTSVGAVRKGFGGRPLDLRLSGQKLLRHSLTICVAALLESHLGHLLVIHREVLRIVEILDSRFMAVTALDYLLDPTRERPLNQSFLLRLLGINSLLRLFGRLLLRGANLLLRRVRGEFLLHLLLISLV